MRPNVFEISVRIRGKLISKALYLFIKKSSNSSFKKELQALSTESHT